MKMTTGLSLLLVTLLVFIDADAQRLKMVHDPTNSVYYNWTERFTGSPFNVPAAAVKLILEDVIITTLGELWVSSDSKYGPFTPCVTAYDFLPGDDSIMGVVAYGTTRRCFVGGVFDNVTYASTAAILASRNGSSVTGNREKVYLHTTGFISSADIQRINTTNTEFVAFLNDHCNGVSTIYRSEALKDGSDFPSKDTVIVNTLTREVHIKLNS